MIFENTLFAPFIPHLHNNTSDHFTTSNVSTDHGYVHAVRVAHNALNAIQWQRNAGLTLPLEIEFAIYCASLLHDADDRKFFNGIGYSNAVNILQTSIPRAVFDSDRTISYEEFLNLIVEMIDLVSTSKNKNRVVDEIWKLIPRDSDRVEALGGIGIIRCYAYSSNSGVSIFTENTPRIKNEEQLSNFLMSSKGLDQYSGSSASCIDHFYDKLIFIGDMKSKNGWLQSIADKRLSKMYRFLFYFGEHGSVDQSYVEYLSRKYSIFY